MNRAHNAHESRSCLEESQKYFENISIDLIYGIPGLSNKRWEENIQIALAYGLPHISSYALTVEPKTALEHYIKKGIIKELDDEQAHTQFNMLVDTLENNDFVHYEISNFGKVGYFSQNNSAYWQGKPYLGIGPSAHSFDGLKRGWNVKNNAKYIKALGDNSLPIEYENLTTTDRFNEYVMTGLRTIWGVSILKVEKDFGITYKDYLLKQAQKYLTEQLLYIEEDILKVTKKGKFLCDGIAAELFKLNLN
jgi:oxygen-independent coproporphyrinogen-3 oxidase